VCIGNYSRGTQGHRQGTGGQYLWGEGREGDLDGQGYAGKFLDVDLTNNAVKNTVFDEATLQAFFGGEA